MQKKKKTQNELNLLYVPEKQTLSNTRGDKTQVALINTSRTSQDLVQSNILVLFKISVIKVNGYCSEFFKLKKGVRQGNLALSILFTLCIKLLAEFIRGNDKLRDSILMHKIVLLVDDILFFIRNPVLSISAIMRCLSNYGEVSRYKVHEGTSEAIMITGSWSKQLDREVKFRWSKGGFRYLGVTLTDNSPQLYTANYDKPFPQVKKDLVKDGRCFLCL